MYIYIYTHTHGCLWLEGKRHWNLRACHRPRCRLSPPFARCHQPWEGEQIVLFDSPDLYHTPPGTGDQQNESMTWRTRFDRALRAGVVVACPFHLIQSGGISGGSRLVEFQADQECWLRVLPCAHRCRADMANIRQSSPESGLGFQVQVLKPFQVDPSSL